MKKEKNRKKEIREKTKKSETRVKNKKSERKESKNTKEKREVPFVKSIRFRLIISFLIPVICIITLGTVSYQKASSAIIASYKNSTEQTVGMMGQYVDLLSVSKKNDFKTYIGADDMQNYVRKLVEDSERIRIKNEYLTEFRSKANQDENIANIYILIDNGDSLTNSSITLPENAYSDYKNSAQGAVVAEDGYSWYVYGSDKEADEILGIDSSTYAFRLARKMNQMGAVLIVDIKASTAREILNSVDPGEGGYVVLVDGYGHEFFSDSTVETTESIIYGTSFYEKAIQGENISGNSIVSIGGKNYLFAYCKMTDSNLLIGTLIPESVVLQETNDIKMLSMALTILAAVIAIILGTMISRKMSGTIQYILRQLRKVSHGDLTVHLTANSKDEFSLLCAGVNDTVGHVKKLIVSVNEVSGQLNDAAAYVNDASNTFQETSSDIQNAVNEIEIGVNKLDSGSEDCLTQMDSLSGKINNVSENTDEIEKLTTSTGTTISTGIATVRGLTTSAESTSRITHHVIESIKELEDKSKSISKIVSAINDIAEQTNLLSLNASIEAARAGEAGRGFSVVAEEIRKLSDQCLSSAGQISNIVNEIVNKTGEVVEIAMEAEEVVSSQTGAVEETTTSFKLIDEQVASLIEALNTISNNVTEMDSSRAETLEAIESISAVSAETAACSSSVHDAAGTQLDAVADLQDASKRLRERADRLAEILGFFQV